MFGATKILGCLVLTLFALSALPVNAQESDDVLADTAFLSITVLEYQMQEAENRRVPEELRFEAECIAVFPSVVKAGFIIAAEQGNGLVTCRNDDDNWGSPTVYSLSAGSIGIQAGIQSASYILLFLDPSAVDTLLSGEITFGADISIAAGPVGAAADSSEQPAVVSYVRTAGLFAGVNLEGVALTFTEDANTDIYGKNAGPEELLFESDALPPMLKPFHAALTKFAP